MFQSEYSFCSFWSKTFGISSCSSQQNTSFGLLQHMRGKGKSPQKPQSIADRADKALADSFSTPFLNPEPSSSFLDPDPIDSVTLSHEPSFKKSTVQTGETYLQTPSGYFQSPAPSFVPRDLSFTEINSFARTKTFLL